MRLLRATQVLYFWGPLSLFVLSLGLFLMGHEAGFWPFMAIFVSVPVGAALALYGFLSLKCSVSSDRYLDFVFLFWPFQSHWQSCQSHAEEALAY